MTGPALRRRFLAQAPRALRSFMQSLDGQTLADSLPPAGATATQAVRITLPARERRA